MDTSLSNLDKAHRLESVGELLLAAEVYQKAIEGGEGEPGVAHQDLAGVLMQLGRLEESVTASQQALALNPDLSRAHAILGAVLSLQGRLEDAEAELQKALLLKPDNAVTLIYLANLYRRSGRNQEANVALTRAVALPPQSREARLFIVQNSWALGEPGKALGLLQAGMRLEPMNLKLYIMYAFSVVLGGMFFLQRKPKLGAVVIAGSVLLALLGPTPIGFVIGSLLSVVTVVILLAIVVIPLKGPGPAGQRRFWVPALVLVLACFAYWLLVLIHLAVIS